MPRILFLSHHRTFNSPIRVVTNSDERVSVYSTQRDPKTHHQKCRRRKRERYSVWERVLRQQQSGAFPGQHKTSRSVRGAHPTRPGFGATPFPSSGAQKKQELLQLGQASLCAARAEPSPAGLFPKHGGRELRLSGCRGDAWRSGDREKDLPVGKPAHPATAGAQRDLSPHGTSGSSRKGTPALHDSLPRQLGSSGQSWGAPLQPLA